MRLPWLGVLLWLLTACDAKDSRSSATGGSGGEVAQSGRSGTAGEASTSSGTGGGRSDAGLSGDPCTETGIGPFLGLFSDEAGKPVDRSFAARVNVIRVDDCSSGCPSSVRVDARRIVFEDPTQDAVDAGPGGQRWSFYVLLEGLPRDLIEVGAAYDLTLSAMRDAIPFGGGALSQTVVLAREGSLVLALITETARFPRPPDLSAFGLSFSKQASTCESPSFGLHGIRHLSLAVSLDGERVLVKRGESTELGPLTIHVAANDSAVNQRFSDAPEKLWFGMYRRP